MEEFEAVWSSSARNSWSYFFPAVVWLGISILFALSYIKQPGARRIMMVLTTLVLTCVATEASFFSFAEKWRIRGEWTDKHWDALTPRQQEIATNDGANLVLGPPINGLFALICFATTMLMISIVRRLKNRPMDSILPARD
jgi:hypothetical protein